MESFSMDDVRKILINRFIIIIGDSVQRAVYKDLVLLLQQDRTLRDYELKAKGEMSFLGDELIEGGRKEKMHNGCAYKEVRQYCVGKHLVRFYFVTRCYNNYMESILKDIEDGPQPDVVIMNSCLWDISRYGRNAIEEYKDNLKKLFERFSTTVPKSCLVIWNTTLPISSCARGGFLIPEIEFLTTTLRLDVLEANYFAQQVAVSYDFDVLDLHFYLRHQLSSRGVDGIHWNFDAHRRISNMMLCHICEAWDLPLPQRKSFKSYGSQAVRRGEPQSLLQLGSTHFQENYARTSSLNQLQFSFGQGQENNFRFGGPFNSHNSERMVKGLHDSFRDVHRAFGGVNNNMNWQPYQQNDGYGHAPSNIRSRYQPYRHQEYKRRQY